MFPTSRQECFEIAFGRTKVFGFGLEPQDVPDVNSAPEVFETAPVYGVPDAPQPEANDVPKDAPDKAKADDASDRDANDKDLKMLNAAEETIEPLATVYGPVNKLDPPRPEVVFMPPQPELKDAPETAPNKAKTDDAVDRNVSDKDLKLLKEAERTNLIYTLYGCE